jgi:hypothetical protein
MGEVKKLGEPMMDVCMWMREEEEERDRKNWKNFVGFTAVVGN